MKIANKCVVAFHYTLFNEAGEQVETSIDSEPSLCLIGASNIMPALEQAMLGKDKGDSFDITLEPHLAYGIYQEGQQERISAKYLKHEGKLRVGQVVRLQTEKGTQTAIVLKVGKFSVDIDRNHPLAGQTIRFDIKIDDVREASAEEVAHGHAHGVGGHQH